MSLVSGGSDMSQVTAKVSQEIAAEAPASREVLTGLLADLLNATGSRWGRMTFEKDGASHVLACNFGALARIWPADPFSTERPRVLGRAVRGEAFLPEAAWKQSDYYLSVLRPGGVEPDHSLVCSVASASGEIVVFLARGAWDNRHTAEEQARAEMLLPMVARTVDLCWALEAERQSAARGKAALDCLSLAILIADETGAVGYDNRAAAQLLQTDDWLTVEDGRVTTVNAAQRDGLLSLIQAACRPVEPRTALIRIQGRSGAWATALVSPFEVTNARTPGRRAMITVRAGGEGDDRMPIIRLLFGFTEAEARLAWALVNGETVAEFAAARAVSVNTARVQLSSVMRKTGVRRQAELVALLSAIPPVRLAAPPPRRKPLLAGARP